jgi:hypothetical protein
MTDCSGSVSNGGSTVEVLSKWRDSLRKLFRLRKNIDEFTRLDRKESAPSCLEM